MIKSHGVSLEPPRGMRDFYPEEMAVRDLIFGAWKTAARRFGFSEYDSSVVENLEILTRKAGEEIVDQIYTFQDKSGRPLALRPEVTPTLARMIAARQGSLSFPVKWFTIAQCFRYERMSRGRKREHYQWNMDIIGESDVSAEAEIIAAAVFSLSLLGLKKGDFLVHISSRTLLSDLLAHLGIAQDQHGAVFLALDKQNKIGEEETHKMLSDMGMDASRIGKLFEMLRISSIGDAVRFLGSCPPSCSNLESLFGLLDSYAIAEFVRFDISIVRGLNYYTGTVFECFDTQRKFRAIFGGGRYDNLLAEIGGKAASCVGLGFGDVVVAEWLADHGCLSQVTPVPAAVAVGFMDPAQHQVAVRLAVQLRNQGQTVDLALHAEKARAFFARTGKGGFQKAVYLGPDDLARGSARMKNLATRQEEDVPLNTPTIPSSLKP